MRFLRWVGGLLLLLVLGLGAAIVLARFHDGPLGPIPGGPLSGAIAPADPGDWSFAAGEKTMAIEVAGRSRTVWFVTKDGTLYVGAADAERKTWPAQAVADGRVVLRIAGRKYERRAVRIQDPETLRAVGDAFKSKYAVNFTPEQAARTWLFRIDPRG